jgi:predicted acetyltransferase
VTSTARRWGFDGPVCQASIPGFNNRIRLRVENSMMIELKELSIYDGKNIFEMLKEIDPSEFGIENRSYEECYSAFREYLEVNEFYSKGIGLDPGCVRQTIYWLLVNSSLIGVGELRHDLTDRLRARGGHIGYVIRPSERGKGYGNLILKELLKKAEEYSLDELLLTCDEDNLISRKVIEANKGKLKEICDGECMYWIYL